MLTSRQMRATVATHISRPTFVYTCVNQITSWQKDSSCRICGRVRDWAKATRNVHRRAGQISQWERNSAEGANERGASKVGTLSERWPFGSRVNCIATRQRKLDQCQSREPHVAANAGTIKPKRGLQHANDGAWLKGLGKQPENAPRSWRRRRPRTSGARPTPTART